MSDLAISIGNFDGVHLGHQALIARARAAVGETGRVLAITFDPPPAVVLCPDRPIERLCTLERRVSTLMQVGADDVEVLETTAELLAQTPGEFIEQHIAGRAPAVLIEGPDFRFGAGRAGTIETLRSLGDQHGFALETIGPVDVELVDLQRVPVRSSGIRRLLLDGRVSDAACMLGRPWRIEGEVVSGDRRGRQLNCPTANLDHGSLMLPGDGIYAGEAWVEGRRHAAAVSIGSKPTFEGSTRLCEAHLLDFDGELNHYGWHLEIDMLERLRDQVRYDSMDALARQIERDLEDVRGVVGARGGTLRRP